MNAREKMDAVGMKALHARVSELRPGTALETLYRWRSSLTTARGISDDRKRLLIAATADSDHPITWADFQPAGVAG